MSDLASWCESFFALLLNIDEKLFAQLNIVWRNELLDTLAPFISMRLPWIFLAFSVLIIVFYKKRHSGIMPLAARLLCVLICLLASDLCVVAAKDLTGRPRPNKAVMGAMNYSGHAWEKTGAIQHPRQPGRSLPSAHAANAMALATALALFFPPLRPFIFLLPLIIGYSRVYLGRHYPMDIAAGWLIGLLASLAVYRLLKWLYTRIPAARRFYPRLFNHGS